jgi:hypothetical protein
LCQLDRRHPLFAELRAFGRALHRIYIRPERPIAPGAVATVHKRLSAPSGAYRPDLDLFDDRKPTARGTMNRKRSGAVLQMLAAADECPLYVLAGALGISLAGLMILVARYRRCGVLTSRGVKVKAQTAKFVHPVSLNRDYPAYKELRRLLDRLNTFDQDYGHMAAAYRRKMKPELKVAMAAPGVHPGNKRRRAPKPNKRRSQPARAK